jgi:putative endonuclease
VRARTGDERHPLGRIALGANGEAAAERALSRLGMRLVERDVRLPGGQLDLVMEEGGRLVVVEVKARRGTGFGLPEEGVGFAKLARLRRLAAAYAVSRRAGVAPRVDVVAVDLDRAGRALAVRHLRDVLS